VHQRDNKGGSKLPGKGRGGGKEGLVPKPSFRRSARAYGKKLGDVKKGKARERKIAWGSTSFMPRSPSEPVQEKLLG